MQKSSRAFPVLRLFYLAIPVALAAVLLALMFTQLQRTSFRVAAAPIEPPYGYPKFLQSSMTVNPELARTTGETLFYTIEIRNTGAYTAEAVTLSDLLPAHLSYNNDAAASSGGPVSFSGGILSWTGTVGFDSFVKITFSAVVEAGFSGVIDNHALISHASLSEPVKITARTVVTEDPILTISKTALPKKPGANKDMTYTLTVRNEGQPATGLLVEVSDQIPQNTVFVSAGPDKVTAPAGTVAFARTVDLSTGESTTFSFTVKVGDVVSGTVIENKNYQVKYLGDRIASGEPYTATVIDPVLYISKYTQPDPPGSNGVMTYTLSVFNEGSLATNLVITDRIPAGYDYHGGGVETDGVVSWTIPSLDTGELAEVQFSIEIGDVVDVPVVNADYGVCSAEGVCAAGDELTSTVFGPNFVISGWMDPVAKKPGGGSAAKTTVTPTLVLENTGPGSALAAKARLCFGNISVSNVDFVRVYPAGRGTLSVAPLCNNGADYAYQWEGDIFAGEVFTFTLIPGGKSTIGGEEGTIYTATLEVFDELTTKITEPISHSVYGKVTHFANLIPVKTAPPEIGAGELMTYSILVVNSGLSTDTPPFPVLTETVPANVTLVSASDERLITTVEGRTVISWSLPPMSTGDSVERHFVVRVPKNAISGTLIVNDLYGTTWSEAESEDPFIVAGEPITTVVKEIGLIDSYKEVSPQTLEPGAGNVLTYTIHVVNSSPSQLNGVEVYDILPWQVATYQRDAVASAGSIISDIVSVSWKGNIGPYSEELITYTVRVDEDFEGVVTNTAVITHESLNAPVEVSVPAYVTNQPVLFISKEANPDPVRYGQELEYTIQVTNRGQQATHLLITDTLPAGVTLVPGTISSRGSLNGQDIEWKVLLLKPGQSVEVSYRVIVKASKKVLNQFYGVTCAEGVSAVGVPLETRVIGGPKGLFLPITVRP